MYLGAGKKYSKRSKYAGGISKVLRRRRGSRKIFKTGDLAKYKGVQTWVNERQNSLHTGQAPNNEDKGIFYNTTLTACKIMMRLLWKEAKFVYLFRNRVRLLPKIYELASERRGQLYNGAGMVYEVAQGEPAAQPSITLNEKTVPNERWKELKMMVRLMRKINPQNNEWMDIVKDQKSALQLAVLFTIANLGIQRMDNFLRAVFSDNYVAVAGNILLALVNITKQVADEYNIIPIISINYVNA